MELVYHNKFSRQSQTGGQTIYSYAGSFCQYQKGVYILGLKAVHFAYLLSWEERINIFVSAGKWQEALKLCRDFYDVHKRNT